MSTPCAGSIWACLGLMRITRDSWRSLKRRTVGSVVPTPGLLMFPLSLTERTHGVFEAVVSRRQPAHLALQSRDLRFVFGDHAGSGDLLAQGTVIGGQAAKATFPGHMSTQPAAPAPVTPTMQQYLGFI
ncbi:hypothetical protein [Burkholderia cenocepacia]|uniref:hypothetical protein n=1 Tax=Burkholderia cenocepacia TaxID=95486 RepID=UPI00196AC6C8|nr:hypothetical protein [Burkholderia cenocepacia]MBN3505650.1 hypothetical protein [Burkholderia cenocepacia]